MWAYEDKHKKCTYLLLGMAIDKTMSLVGGIMQNPSAGLACLLVAVWFVPLLDDNVPGCCGTMEVQL